MNKQCQTVLQEQKRKFLRTFGNLVWGKPHFSKTLLVSCEISVSLWIYFYRFEWSFARIQWKFVKNAKSHRNRIKWSVKKWKNRDSPTPSEKFKIPCWQSTVNRLIFFFLAIIKQNGRHYSSKWWSIDSFKHFYFKKHRLFSSKRFDHPLKNRNFLHTINLIFTTTDWKAN